jgi:hypothetical protein
MMNSKLKISLLACFSFLFILTSCSNNDVNVSEFADDTLFLVESETRSGRLGCYELVYPVTLDFPDGSSQEVNDGEALRAAVKSWKENNQDVNGRPFLAFPYDIVTEDGKLITVETLEQKRKLQIACKVKMGNGPHGHLGKPCFRMVYPITILFPDESTAEVASRMELKMTLRLWKKDNPDAEERPSIVFPLTVMFEDETTQVVENREELKQLKIDCRG